MSGQKTKAYFRHSKWEKKQHLWISQSSPLSQKKLTKHCHSHILLTSVVSSIIQNRIVIFSLNFRLAPPSCAARGRHHGENRPGCHYTEQRNVQQMWLRPMKVCWVRSEVVGAVLAHRIFHPPYGPLTSTLRLVSQALRQTLGIYCKTTNYISYYNL